MALKSYAAWAIKLREHEGWMAGIYFFVNKAPQMHGSVRTATWATRREARAAMAKRFPPGSYAREAYAPKVVSVEVSIKETA